VNDEPIKPKDIPRGLYFAFLDWTMKRAAESDVRGRPSDEEQIATVLNKAIEMGIVSLSFPHVRDDADHVVRTDGPITLGDVPVELGEYANQTCVWYDGPQVDVVSVLNKAIELGIVSPPCHYYERNGWRERCGGIIKLWPGKPEVDFYKHWKGEE
jgi:hypothetical protein